MKRKGKRSCLLFSMMGRMGPSLVVTKVGTFLHGPLMTRMSRGISLMKRATMRRQMTAIAGVKLLTGPARILVMTPCQMRKKMMMMMKTGMMVLRVKKRMKMGMMVLRVMKKMKMGKLMKTASDLFASRTCRRLRLTPGAAS